MIHVQVIKWSMHQKRNCSSIAQKCVQQDVENNKAIQQSTNNKKTM